MASSLLSGGNGEKLYRIFPFYKPFLPFCEKSFVVQHAKNLIFFDNAIRENRQIGIVGELSASSSLGTTAQSGGLRGRKFSFDTIPSSSDTIGKSEAANYSPFLFTAWNCCTTGTFATVQKSAPEFPSFTDRQFVRGGQHDDCVKITVKSSSSVRFHISSHQRDDYGTWKGVTVPFDDKKLSASELSPLMDRITRQMGDFLVFIEKENGTRSTLRQIRRIRQGLGEMQRMGKGSAQVDEAGEILTKMSFVIPSLIPLVTTERLIEILESTSLPERVDILQQTIADSLARIAKLSSFKSNLHHEKEDTYRPTIDTSDIIHNNKCGNDAENQLNNNSGDESDLNKKK